MSPAGGRLGCTMREEETDKSGGCDSMSMPLLNIKVIKRSP